MYCKHCGKEIAEDSLFCKWCGNRVDKSTPVQHGKSYATTATKNELGVEEQKRQSSLKTFSILLFATVVLIALAMFGTLSEKAPANTNSIHPTENMNKEQLMDYYYSYVVDCTEQTVIDVTEIKNPSYNYDDKKFLQTGAQFSLTGDISYKNKSDKLMTRKISSTVIIGDEGTACYFLKIGSEVYINCLDWVDSEGRYTKIGATVKNCNAGDYVLSNVINIDKMIPAQNSSSLNDADQISESSTENRSKMTYSEYMEIKTGMTYDEVTEIVGSYGTELSRTDIAGYVTVMVGWEGEGTVGATANVTFQNGTVIAKAQMGLE